MTTEKHSYKVQIWVAIIGLIGVLGTAIIANWDKIFSNDSDILAEQHLEERSETGKLGGAMCTLSGLVFDSDSNKPLPSIRVDLYRDLSEIQQRPKQLKAGVATTGPNGKFSINCNWVKDSEFPLLLALRHRDWATTQITGPKIDRSNEWDGINIPISISGVDLKPKNKLKEVLVGFSSKKIGSDWILLGRIENKSQRSFSCIRARFNMTTSYRDKIQGEPDQHLGFLDVEVEDLKPNEKRQYKKTMPKRVGISLHTIQEC